jgi:hypothetical protein
MADESGCVTARTAKVRSVTTDADVLGRLPPALRSRCSSKKMLAVHGRPRQHLQPVERCYRSMRGIGLMKPQVSVSPRCSDGSNEDATRHRGSR